MSVECKLVYCQKKCIPNAGDCGKIVFCSWKLGGARGVMVIIVGNEHSDISSNPGWDWLHFTLH